MSLFTLTLVHPRLYLLGIVQYEAVHHRVGFVVMVAVGDLDVEKGPKPLAKLPKSLGNNDAWAKDDTGLEVAFPRCDISRTVNDGSSSP
jgi:hypothetical protein